MCILQTVQMMVTRMRACNSRTTFHYVLSIAGSISVFARKSNGSVVQFKWTDGSHYLTISGPALDRHHQLVVINLAWKSSGFHVYVDRAGCARKLHPWKRASLQLST